MDARLHDLPFDPAALRRLAPLHRPYLAIPGGDGRTMAPACEARR